MNWCENNSVDYIFGLARNVRLVGAVKRELVLARRASRRSGRAERRFTVLENWDTREGWAKPRKVVAKAEWTRRQGQSALHRDVAALVGR